MAFTLTLPATLIGTTLVTSSSQAVPQGETDAYVTLVDTNTEWDAKAGTGSLIWGGQALVAGTWQWIGDNFETNPFGQRSRTGAMPSTHVVLPSTGTDVRLAAHTTTGAITLGVKIELLP